jgi:HK97 family phage portal protein
VGLRDNLRALTERWTAEQRGISSQDFARGADIDNLFQSATGARVTLSTALTLPVFSRCVNLYVDDIAQLPVDAYRRAGKARVEMDKPEWMRSPALDPNYSWGDHISDVVFSLVTDRNAFIRAYPDRFRPMMLEVLDPEDVDTRTQRMAVVYVQRSTGETIPADQMVHIRAAKSPGQTRATSRVETLRETIGLGLAAEQYGARFFRNNATPTLGVEVPAGVVVDADKLKKDLERNHRGLERSHAIGVLTGGATFKQLSIDADKAQLLGLKEAVVEDVARDFGIPPYLAGSTSPGAVAYASTSNARIDYVVHGVVGIVDRLETAYSSLLPGDDTFVRFGLNALLRGDQPTRFAAYQVGLQNRFVKVDEVRGWEDWEPFGGDDGGFLNTPNNSAAGSGPDQPEDSPAEVPA